MVSNCGIRFELLLCFVRRKTSNRVERDNETEIATQSIHRNLFNNKTNVMQMSHKTLWKSIL